MKLTREQIIDIIEDLLDVGLVYNARFNEFKHRVSNAFDTARTEVAKQFTYAGAWQNLSMEEQRVVDVVPYEMRHWYGKSFTRTLAEAPTTPYIAALRTVVEQWRPVYEGMEHLKTLIKPGKAPVERSRKVIGTRTQFRGECPCCGRLIALDGAGKMCDHGFQINWNARRGSCYGDGKPYFGSEAGRDFAVEWAATLVSEAARKDATADAVQRGETKLYDSKAQTWIEKPTQKQLDTRANELRAEARSMHALAKSIRQRVADWKPVPAVQVEVEIYE
jgi:hypothetical protein